MSLNYPLNPLSPGVAGHAGTKERVGDADGHEMLMKPTVYPAVRHHVRAVCDGAAWKRVWQF